MSEPDYRAAYQTVLENVVKLEEENERLEAENERLKKDNRRLLLQKMTREGQEAGLYDDPSE